MQLACSRTRWRRGSPTRRSPAPRRTGSPRRSSSSCPSSVAPEYQDVVTLNMLKNHHYQNDIIVEFFFAWSQKNKLWWRGFLSDHLSEEGGGIANVSKKVRFKGFLIGNEWTLRARRFTAKSVSARSLYPAALWQVVSTNNTFSSAYSDYLNL